MVSQSTELSMNILAERNNVFDKVTQLRNMNKEIILPIAWTLY